MPFLLLSYLTAMKFKAIGGNIELPKWMEGPGRQVDNPASQLETEVEHHSEAKK